MRPHQDLFMHAADPANNGPLVLFWGEMCCRKTVALLAKMLERRLKLPSLHSYL